MKRLVRAFGGAAVAAMLVVVSAREAGLVGGVYTQTKHGNTTTGVNRIPDWPIGSCEQCHLQHDSTSPNAFALFAPNTNALCYTAGCHSASGARGIYQGPTVYNASRHASTTNMVWPGPDLTVDAAAPPANLAGDWGKCINCHDPHGYNRDGTGLIPSLTFSREEKLCYVCHDGSPAKDAKSDFTKTVHHPVVNTDPLRRVGRSVECTDCHNAHVATGPSHTYSTIATSTRSQITPPLVGVSGVQFNYLGLLNWPAYNVGWYTAIPYSTGATYEYQICFKCHSSYFWGLGTPPNGLSANGAVASPVETDLAQEFSPSNKSGHPVVTGLNNYPNSTVPKALTAAGMAAPFNTNVGTQTMMCSDCHNTDAASTAAQGPHGSAVPFMLRGPNTYWPTDALGAKYNLGNNTNGTAFLAGLFCLNCHPMRPTTTTWVNNVHDIHSGQQGVMTPDQNACVACHIVIPHGGKVSRLVATQTAGLPARYAYSNTTTNVWVTAFKKAASPTGYAQTDCSNAGCGAHGAITGAEIW